MTSRPETAESFVAAEQDKLPGARRKFSAFKKAIVQPYPELSKKDVDGEDDRNVWEEGLSVSAASGKVWPLALKQATTDEALVAAIVAAANTVGLHVYDDEGQVLYHSRGEVIAAGGPSLAAAPPDDEDPERIASDAHLRKLLVECMRPMMERRGFGVTEKPAFRKVGPSAFAMCTFSSKSGTCISTSTSDYSSSRSSTSSSPTSLASTPADERLSMWRTPPSGRRSRCRPVESKGFATCSRSVRLAGEGARRRAVYAPRGVRRADSRRLRHAREAGSLCERVVRRIASHSPVGRDEDDRPYAVGNPRFEAIASMFIEAAMSV